MPALFGYLQRSEAPATWASEQVERMAATFDAKHPFTVDSLDCEHFAARNFRFDDGISSTSAESNVMLDGYLLDCSNSKYADSGDEIGATSIRKEERLIWNLFVQHGEAFIDYLSGVFNACIYDQGSVILVNCRHGARHIFYVLNPKYFAFATEPKALLAIEGARKTANRNAIYDMFNFGYVRGCETMFEEIQLLEQATILKVDREKGSKSKYWEYRYANDSKANVFDDLVEEARELFRMAITTYIARFPAVGIPLSGGLDSRTILAYVSREISVPVFHCSWYSREEGIAMDLCKVTGCEWHRFDPLNFDFAGILKEGVEISCGNTHCHQFWFLPIAKLIFNHGWAELLLDGYLMDVFFGDTFLVLPTKDNYDRDEKRDIINGIWRRCKPIFVKRAFSPQFYSEYEEANRDSIYSEMDKIDEEKLSNFIQRFSLSNRSNRYSVALPNVQRQYVEYGFPGLDYRLTDLYLRLPPEYKKDARFYRAVIEREFPEVAAVPWAKTGKSLYRSKSMIDKLFDALPVKQATTKALLQLSGSRLDVSHRGDLNRHFRQNPRFRAAFLNLLNDPRTYSRGIIEAKGLQTLIRQIDSGWPAMALLQSLTTVELWYRQFVDA